MSEVRSPKTEVKGQRYLGIERKIIVNLSPLAWLLSIAEVQFKGVNRNQNNVFNQYKSGRTFKYP